MGTCSPSELFNQLECSAFNEGSKQFSLVTVLKGSEFITLIGESANLNVGYSSYQSVMNGESFRRIANIRPKHLQSQPPN